MLSIQSMLRAEIGDAEYEQYRQANGWPTVVEVAAILESSPAQQAGLQAGDQIVSYNGTRVFDIGELNRFTMGSDPGGTVVVDIVRDGIPMQVVLPSGPIGVTVGGRRGR
jgi:S1-C subfamily serine protease